MLSVELVERFSSALPKNELIPLILDRLNEVPIDDVALRRLGERDVPFHVLYGVPMGERESEDRPSKRLRLEPLACATGSALMAL